MDPDTTLRDLRALLEGDHGEFDADARGQWLRHIHGRRESLSISDLHKRICEAEELWQALDTWMTKGGALPLFWMEGR